MAFGSFGYSTKLGTSCGERFKIHCPTKLNLYKRQVVSDGCCDVCRTCLEDNTHALCYCDVVRAVWQTNVRFNFIRTKKLSTFADLVQFLCSHGSSDLFARFAMVAWSIWE